MVDGNFVPGCFRSPPPLPGSGRFRGLAASPPASCADSRPPHQPRVRRATAVIQVRRASIAVAGKPHQEGGQVVARKAIETGAPRKAYGNDALISQIWS